MLKRIAFLIVLSAALGLAAYTFRRFYRMIRAGKPADRFDRPADRIQSVVDFFFGQKKVIEEAYIPSARWKGFVKSIGSKYHFLIFWGFIIITIGTTETLAAAVIPDLTLDRLLGIRVAHFVYASIDWATLTVLVVIGFSVFRRMVLQPHLIPMSPDAALILGTIASLMLTHFGIQVFHLVAEGGGNGAYPISEYLAGWLIAIPSGTAKVLSEINWWIHVLLVLGFGNYLLYSKHSHIVAAFPNILFRNLEQRGVLPKLNLEADDIAKIGIVESYKDFTWKSILDSFACTECARCSNACPAYTTGKPLSPMQVVHDLRDDLKSNLPDRGLLDDLMERFQHGRDGEASIKEKKPLVGGRTTEEVLWACTTCGACLEVCPVFIDQPEKILQMRQNLVMLQEKVPADLARTFKNLEQNGNPWGIGSHKRMDWAEGHNVPTLDERPDAEYLLWVGCAGSYDDRIKKQTLALVEILTVAKVDFAVLGLEEGCTGDPARRSGNEMLYQMQAQQNVEVMNSKNVKKVVTACPHCLHTIKNEYPQLGGNFEVVHHTQLIRQLMDEDRLPIEKDADGVRKIAYHDPCYLGRWNNEYDAPRETLDAIGQQVVVERSREKGFCCGAGGGRMWMEETIGTRVNHNRVDELLATGADTIATACPFCTIMLHDGVADRGAEERVVVLNVSELVTRSMARRREIDAQSAANKTSL